MAHPRSLSSASVARNAILADLQPVRRLGPPSRRALAACAAGGIVLGLVPAWFGVRADVGQMPGSLLWGFYLLQLVYACLLVVATLRDAVPGRSRPRQSAVLFAGGLGLVVAITAITWLVHPTPMRDGGWWQYSVNCFTRPLVLGLPPLALTLYLVARAYPLRPALVGALGGLGIGLLVDASWRTYCQVTNPLHVLTSHFGAVLTLSLAGALIASLHARSTRRLG